MASSTVPFGLLVILAPGQSLRSGLGLKGSLCNVTEPQVEGSWGVGWGRQLPRKQSGFPKLSENDKDFYVWLRTISGSRVA